MNAVPFSEMKISSTLVSFGSAGAKSCDVGPSSSFCRICLAKQILQKLLEGPTSQDFAPALPKDTKVEEIFISEKGTAFIDFTNTIAMNHPGGILNEQATVYAIVNSLT